MPVGEGVLQAVDDYQDSHEPVEVSLPWLRPDGDLLTVKLLIDKAADGVRTGANPDTARFWRGYNFQSSVWRPAVERAGLGYTARMDGMHALRHFFASVMLAQGVSIKELSVYLGHHDPAFTLRIYTHLMPSSHKRARLASNTVFRPRAFSEAA